MKKHISQILSVILLALAITGSKHAAAQDIQVSFQTFYDNLAPYGQWVYDPDYGNVWVPNEGGDFRPYGSRGQWVMTEYGNTWVSDDPWGWAVYHYGRWTYNPYYGWIWVPGYEWAPAWVSWRYGGGYAGWAPLAPGINIGVTYYAPDSWWVFMGPQYMYQPNCIRYWYGPSYNRNYMHHTTIINNYYIDNSTRVRYNYGPRAEVIQQTTGHPVRVYQVNHRNRPGAPSVGRNSVSIYRPTVNPGSVRDARPARVVQAPRSIGRGTQPVQQGNVQPAFRQELPRLQQQGGRGNEDRDGGRMQQEDRPQRGRYDNDNDGRGRVQEQPQPGRYENDNGGRGQRGEDRPQPGRYDNDNGGRGRTQQEQPQPGRFDNGGRGHMRDDRPVQPQRDDRPQPGRFDNQPGRQPQPQREERPQPQRQPEQPQPQRQPEYRPQPQPQRQPEQRPQPERQPEQRPQPQPQRQPQYEPRPQPRQEAPQRQPQPQPQGQPQQGGRPQGGGRR